MNHILFAIGCLLFLIPNSVLTGRNAASVEESYRVVLSQESKLSILGKTNVNHFQCKYTQSIEPQVLGVDVRYRNDGLYFSNAFIRLQTIHFTCGPSQMNEDLQAFLKVKEHPTATIRLLKLRLTQEQTIQKAISEMEITLAGVTKRYLIPVTISNSGEEHLLKGSLDLNICDFNLEPPVVMMGLIRVKEDVKINFELRACIEKNIIN